VGYDLTKRLSYLKAQSEADRVGVLTFWGVFFKALLLLLILSFFVSQISAPRIPKDQEGYSKWQIQTRILVDERKEYFLDALLFGETRARLYVKFANNVISTFGVDEPDNSGDQSRLLDFDGWSSWFSEAFTGIILRFAFLLFACTHLWIIGFGVGALVFKYLLIPRSTKDALGFLNRGRSAFYSGIYGPLRPNTSASGTDLSAPSLACPKKAAKSEAMKHPIASTLSRYGAMNETNIGLTQVILAYRDYPATVDEERVVEESEDSPAPTASFRTNEEGTIEESAKECLAAVLSAHAVLKTHYSDKDENISPSEEDYLKHAKGLEELSKKLTPLARQLLLLLTPARGLALSKLPAQAVASSYLAIEAGKYLVYRKEGTAYFPVSRFPHLQARAVIQSLVSYHQDYSGDLRMTIRQAIISSRRHGDFGRAFLPVHMSMASRAMRDWLEVLFSSRKRREGFAHLVELDANLEEIQLNFRKEFIRRLVSSGVHERAGKGETNSSLLKRSLWKGFAYKSVVLFPLKDLIEVALTGTNPDRLKRVTELMKTTKKLQASLSISARLPGFKRQAEVAEKDAIESGGVTRAIAETHEDEKLLAGWLIIRRTLTRYNWLSTRVGDSAVPADGLIQAVVLDRTGGDRPEALGMDALVPLRQRRFKELLGSKWETQFYSHSPSANDVDIYEEISEYHEGLSMIREQVARGAFDRQRAGNKG